jgi:hypothetical protein
MPEGTVTARLTVEDAIGIESDATTGAIETDGDPDPRDNGRNAAADTD